MNAIITKLNEIEEKAELILRDAGEKKDALQLEEQKREIDAAYDRKEAEAMQRLEEQLTAGAKQKLEELRK